MLNRANELIEAQPPTPPDRSSRAAYEAAAKEFAAADPAAIMGALVNSSKFPAEPLQVGAWKYEIANLQEIAQALPEAYVFPEFTIPRIGRRADAIIVLKGVIYVLEYKVGQSSALSSDLDQAHGYALDLKHFHESSHNLPIVPILIATDTKADAAEILFRPDGVAQPLLCASAGLLDVLNRPLAPLHKEALDAKRWARGRYKPTPTIIEAAQALYRNHSVEEITRSEAGAENLTITADYVAQVIEDAKRNNTKAICFITGVPGSGKTLAGLNIATQRMRSHDDEHAVFLSGNGPLVSVLREALTLDALAQPRPSAEPRPTKTQEARKAEAFIQNIHHFRDASLESAEPPIEKVVIFDEAQRAWDAEQTTRFMREKRGQSEFNQSEPAFLLSIMDRHRDWCVVVCLVGEGQEINTGEAGILEWLIALAANHSEWTVHASNRLIAEHAATISLPTDRAVASPALHLAVSLRSFRAERLSDFVAEVIRGDAVAAEQIEAHLTDYPLFVTRNLADARCWLRASRRGMERAGLLASSNALRLKPEGVFVKAKIDPPQWFLAPHVDVRSSDALEDVGTEFDVQGLELDWACVCWDANFRRSGGEWSVHTFKGTRWQKVADPHRQRYIANAYRVLLTRARQGLVVFVPNGENADETRSPTNYDETFAFLLECGLRLLPTPTGASASDDRSSAE